MGNALYKGKEDVNYKGKEKKHHNIFGHIYL
jgi:hypothetical protein